MAAGAILKLAWRNLGRHRRRTIITALAIGLGLALLVVSSALGDGVHGEMIKQGVGMFAGHVVVQGPGWQEKREPELAVKDAGPTTEEIRAAVPDAVVLPRLFLQGLLTSPEGSVGVQVVGVEPDLEREVNNLAEKVVKGTYLSADDDRGIVIGDTLAETLSVDLGDKVVLMSQRKGEIESRLFRVRGIFRTGLGELDGFFAQVPLAAAQAVLGLGDVANQISVHLSDPDRTASVTRLLRQRLSDRPVDVLPWQQALPELHQFVVLDDAGLYVFILIIALVVAFGITNTVLMSVMERVKEFGVLLSLGMTPRRLGWMVLAEASLLGVLSAVGGAALGALLAWPLQVYGLDYGALIGTEEGFETAGVMIESLVYGDLSWTKVILFSGITVVLTVIAALYPTWKASRLRPVEAMHHA